MPPENSGDEKGALRDSEERFRLLVESVRHYAIFMLSPSGHVITWNAGAERFKGYKAHEIIGQHFSRFYPPEALATLHVIAQAIGLRGVRWQQHRHLGLTRLAYLV